MILLFGPTGAGKSMQGQMLAVRQGWKWLSTGEMLRQSTDEELIATLKSGELVSDELTYQVFEEAVQDARDKQYGNIIIDGFPRTKEQAAWLDEYMASCIRCASSSVGLMSGQSSPALFLALLFSFAAFFCAATSASNAARSSSVAGR